MVFIEPVRRGTDRMRSTQDCDWDSVIYSAPTNGPRTTEEQKGVLQVTAIEFPCRYMEADALAGLINLQVLYNLV